MSEISHDLKSPTGIGDDGSFDLRVVDRIRESDTVVSLVLRPADDAQWVPFRAGQHLPIRLGLPRRPIATYTISSSPHERGFYRISVKREAGGLGGSVFLHNLKIGSILRAQKPKGRFVLDDGAGPVVLLTGGVGITPSISMLKALIQAGDREVYFIHAARNRREQAFRNEILEVTKDKPHVRLFFAYAEGGEEDIVAGRCDHLGLIDRAVLKTILPLDVYTVYCCGPTGFMNAMRAALISLGVPSDAIFQEHFGPVPGAPVAVPASFSAKTYPDDRWDPNDESFVVRFRRSGLVAQWKPSAGSLLDLAEEAGLSPEFSCRAGVCGTCACALLTGEIEYDEEPVEPPPSGHVLICCSRPRGPIELDL